MTENNDECLGCELTSADFFKIIMDEEKRMQFLIRHGLILKTKECGLCGNMCTITKKSNRFVFRCRKTTTLRKSKKDIKKTCDTVESVWRNTFFEDCQLGAEKLCMLVHYEMGENNSITKFLQRKFECSSSTVINWRHYLREVFMEWAADSNNEKLGGPGKTVEIDESFIRKRKNNCGQIVCGQWVFGVYEKEGDRLIIIPVRDRKKYALLDIIKEHILEGTTIVSDCWALYKCFKNKGFQHLTVNHKYNLVDPISRAHTQNIERKWRVMKNRLPKYYRKREHYMEYLALFFFKRKYPKNTRYHNAFQAIAKLYSPLLEEKIYRKTVYKYNKKETEWDDASSDVLRKLKI